MSCHCGHAIEEHGHDPRHPGSMACTECECIAYEEADDEGLSIEDQIHMEITGHLPEDF